MNSITQQELKDKINKLRDLWQKADNMATVGEAAGHILIPHLEEQIHRCEEQFMDITIPGDSNGNEVITYNRGQAMRDVLKKLLENICNAEKERLSVEQQLEECLKTLGNRQELSDFRYLTGETNQNEEAPNGKRKR